MELTELMQIISTLGFPIVVCLVCFWYINKMTETHKEEMNSVKEALNNNTIVLNRILDKLNIEE